MLGRIFQSIAGLALLFSLAAGVRAEFSLAYVDAARLLKDAPQINQIKQEIREEFKARDQRLVEMQKQIGLLEAKLVGAGEEIDEEGKHRLRNDINNRKLKYKHARDELEQDKQLRFSEEEEHFSRIIHEVIQQVAQDEKLDLVLQSGVLWVSPKVNITDKVLNRLQRMLEKGN